MAAACTTRASTLSSWRGRSAKAQKVSPAQNSKQPSRWTSLHDSEDEEEHQDEGDPIDLAMAALNSETSEEQDEEVEAIEEDEAFAVLAAWKTASGQKNKWMDSRKIVREKKTARGF